MATSITYPFNCFMALIVAGTEVSGVGYVRRPATFAETAEAGFAANATSVQWPACGSDWGTVDTVNLYDAATGGNLLCTEQATSAVRGNMYDELRVSASGYQVYSAASVVFTLSIFTITYTYISATRQRSRLVLRRGRLRRRAV